MSILTTAAHEEEIGGQRRPLALRNRELDRFEAQYAPFGVFELWDQLCGRGVPQRRHVRDLVALALVGGGMPDVVADRLIEGLPPSEDFALRGIAFRALGVAFHPTVTERKKKGRGSRRDRETTASTTAPGTSSQTSAA